jgi:metal-sulfur cluster biosynthetic enzyme
MAGTGGCYVTRSVALAAASARHAEARARINAIHDPCSIASNVPIGIVDMGIVHSLEVDGDRVSVRVRPTFPGCLYVGLFAQEIDRVLTALPWCQEVDVSLAEGAGVWSEESMAPAARSRLADNRMRRLELIGSQR